MRIRILQFLLTIRHRGSSSQIVNVVEFGNSEANSSSAVSEFGRFGCSTNSRTPGFGSELLGDSANSRILRFGSKPFGCSANSRTLEFGSELLKAPPRFKPLSDVSLLVDLRCRTVVP